MPDERIQRDGDTWKLPDGMVIRRRTKRLRLVVFRQRYVYKGEFRYSSCFYFAKMINGVRELFPLGTDAADAAKKADEIGAYLALPTSSLEEAKRIYDPRGVARKTHLATIAEVFEAHKTSWRSIGISDASGKGYQYALVMILRYVEAYRAKRPLVSQSGRKMDITPWTKQPTTVLTAKLLLDFKAAMVADLEDEEEILTAQISCDSFMRQARSVFSEEARRYYRHMRLPLPDLAEWFEVPLFGAKKYFELPSMETVMRVFAALPGLKKSDLNAWRAFMLCTHLGLRKSEAGFARWSWIEEPGPVMKIREDGAFKPKHGHGRKIQLEPWVWTQLKEARASIDTIICGEEHERTDQVFERLNVWLKSKGISATKPTHELRKLWFSYTAKVRGILAAQQQGGHSDPKVTSDSYADNMMPDELLPYWKGEKTG